jgi:hypothetical protein
LISFSCVLRYVISFVRYIKWFNIPADVMSTFGISSVEMFLTTMIDLRKFRAAFTFTDRVAVSVKLFARIREVFGSNLSRDTGLFWQISPGFTQLFQPNSSITPRPLPSTSITFHHSSIILTIDAIQYRQRRRRKVTHRENIRFGINV